MRASNSSSTLHLLVSSGVSGIEGSGGRKWTYFAISTQATPLPPSNSSAYLLCYLAIDSEDPLLPRLQSVLPMLKPQSHHFFCFFQGQGAGIVLSQTVEQFTDQDSLRSCCFEVRGKEGFEAGPDLGFAVLRGVELSVVFFGFSDAACMYVKGKPFKVFSTVHASEDPGRPAAFAVSVDLTLLECSGTDTAYEAHHPYYISYGARRAGRAEAGP